MKVFVLLVAMFALVCVNAIEEEGETLIDNLKPEQFIREMIICLFVILIYQHFKIHCYNLRIQIHLRKDLNIKIFHRLMVNPFFSFIRAVPLA